MLDAEKDEDDTGLVSAEEEAYRHILAKIRLGELGPGARVRTEDVAAGVGMSRQPVREAIRRLEAEGYVTVRPNRGAMVSKHTPEQLLELFEIRAVLEGLAMRLAASRVQPQDIVMLEASITAIEHAGTETNTMLARHNEFHIQLSGLSARPRLTREIARMHATLEPYMRLWFLRCGTPTHSRDDHAKLLLALRSGYPAHAEEVMRDHVLETAPMIIAQLEEVGGIEPSVVRKDRRPH
jgi:DNA-binding GntR family transcriptional regulator